MSAAEEIFPSEQSDPPSEQRDSSSEQSELSKSARRLQSEHPIGGCAKGRLDGPILAWPKAAKIGAAKGRH